MRHFFATYALVLGILLAAVGLCFVAEGVFMHLPDASTRWLHVIAGILIGLTGWFFVRIYHRFGRLVPKVEVVFDRTSVVTWLMLKAIQLGYVLGFIVTLLLFAVFAVPIIFFAVDASVLDKAAVVFLVLPIPLVYWPFLYFGWFFFFRQIHECCGSKMLLKSQAKESGVSRGVVGR